MTRGAGGSHGVMHDGPAQWKVEIEGCHARRRRRPPSFALLANGDTRKWVLTGPVSLRDGMEGMIQKSVSGRERGTPSAQLNRTRT